MRHLYLADAGTSRTAVQKYLLQHVRLLNVDNNTAGIASWLDWQGTVAEIALFESTQRTPLVQAINKPLSASNVPCAFCHSGT